MKKITIIDGNSLLFRAFYATSRPGVELMKSRSGVPTNAIFAFGNMLSKILGTVNPDDLFFVAFDADGDTFRKEELSDYKANRKPCPEELVPQFPLSRRLLDALGAFHYELHGYEADDLAGTVATLAEKEGLEVHVYTSDKDYLQLVSDKVTLHVLKSGLSDVLEVTPKNILELYGYTAAQVPDFKGLRGDASDNLKGIPGVGDKGAMKLLAKYGTFEEVVAHADEIGGKTGASIKEHAEEGRQSYRLALIKRDVELPFSLDDLTYRGYERSDVLAFCKELDLSQLPNRLPSSWVKKEEIGESKEGGLELLDEVFSEKITGICVDFASPLYHDAEIGGIAFASSKAVSYIPHEDLSKALPRIKEAVDEEDRILLPYSSKELAYLFLRLGVECSCRVEDLLSAAYLLSPDIAGKKEAAYAALLLDYQGDEKSMSREKCMAQARSHLRFEKVVTRLKEEGLYSLYEEIERPLATILARMEYEGIPLNKELLSRLGDEYAKKRDDAEAVVFSMAGTSINLNSPKQIAELLFDKLKLPNPKGGSTSVEVLNELAVNYPVALAILEYRKYAKLVSTYVDGLLDKVGEDGKVHTYFNQALTATGRLSSSEPNLQNIATRDEEGARVKEAFSYDDGSVLVSLDYSQIELRVLASLSGCQSYIETFTSGIDVHEETARRIFHSEKPTSLERRRAKAVNFAVIYGSTIYGLAEQIGCPVGEATRLIDDFYNHYPEIKEYLQKTVSSAEKLGYCSTLFGRRRYLPDLHSSAYQKREAARRQALNAPIQGTAADIIKKAMIKIDTLLRDGGYLSKMVLQIHDELIFKVPIEELGDIRPLLEEAMETAVRLNVPLSVEGGFGTNWKEAKE